MSAEMNPDALIQAIAELRAALERRDTWSNGQVERLRSDMNLKFAEVAAALASTNRVLEQHSALCSYRDIIQDSARAVTAHDRQLDTLADKEERLETAVHALQIENAKGMMLGGAAGGGVVTIVGALLYWVGHLLNLL